MGLSPHCLECNLSLTPVQMSRKNKKTIEVSLRTNDIMLITAYSGS